MVSRLWDSSSFSSASTTEDLLDAIVTKAIRASRDNALDAAIVICDDIERIGGHALDCATALRAFKERFEKSPATPETKLAIKKLTAPPDARDCSDGGFITKMPDNEVIVEIGAEGGSITLFGVRSPRGWLYSRSVGELIDEERSQHDSNVVGSWKAALGLLDQYPWHLLYPLHVHLEFRRRVLAAVRKRFESSDDPWGRMEKWRELCEGTNDLGHPLTL